MPTIDNNGTHIYYETHGEGPAILLSHGFSATSQMWKPQLQALSQDHTLIFWDFRGHGRSDAPEDLSITVKRLPRRTWLPCSMQRDSKPQLSAAFPWVVICRSRFTPTTPTE